MRIPHFFKAGSRLGTQNPPYRQANVNFGVEKAPDFILTKYFLSKFSNYKLDSFDFPLPEEIDSENLFSIIATHYSDMKSQIDTLLKTNETQIVIGGDDSVTFPSILAVLERVNPQRLGYIRFDSHGDMNLYKDSPTKNFHGMYMRPLYGDFDIPEISNLVNSKLKPGNSVFIGNLDLDPEEKLFFEKVKINKVDKKRSFNLKRAIDFTSKLVEEMSHIHISIDIDAFDESIAPATGIPVENGLLKEEVFPILKILRNSQNLSFDLVEVNPLKAGAYKTIALAQQIIFSLVS
ncbi:MAG: arginase family protein [Patescibacteria group bacterium]